MCCPKLIINDDFCLLVLNNDTPEVIKRRNLADDRLIEISQILRENGSNHTRSGAAATERNKREFFVGMQEMSKTSVDVFIPFTTMMPGTDVAQPKPEKYDMKTKYRMLPRQFRISVKIFEIEEVQHLLTQCRSRNICNVAASHFMKLMSDRILTLQEGIV